MPLTIEALGRVSLFADLKPKELDRLLKSFRERSFVTGDVVMAEGGTGTGFFVIESGTAVVHRAGRDLARLGPGATFGEIALIDGGTRTATVTAETELRCHALSAWDFRGIAESDARISWSLVQVLARRLRDAELDD